VRDGPSGTLLGRAWWRSSAEPGASGRDRLGRRVYVVSVLKGIHRASSSERVSVLMSAYDLIGGGCGDEADHPLYVYVEPALLADLYGPRLIITPDYIGPEGHQLRNSGYVPGGRVSWARRRGLVVVVLAGVVAVVVAVVIASVVASHAGAQRPSPRPIVQPGPPAPAGGGGTPGTARHRGTARNGGSARHGGGVRRLARHQRPARRRPAAGRAGSGHGRAAPTCDGSTPPMPGRRCVPARAASDRRSTRAGHRGARVGPPLAVGTPATGTPWPSSPMSVRWLPEAGSLSG